MIVVETGQGLENAETYCDTAFVDQYAASSNNTTWTSLAVEVKESALREAALVIDGKFGGRFLGCRKCHDQALEWPRYEARDENGFYVDSDTVPIQVKKACADLAIAATAQSSSQLIQDSDTTAPIIREMRKVGPLETETEFGGGGKRANQINFHRARMILRRLLLPAGTLHRG